MSMNPNPITVLGDTQRFLHLPVFEQFFQNPEVPIKLVITPGETESHTWGLGQEIICKNCILSDGKRTIEVPTIELVPNWCQFLYGDQWQSAGYDYIDCFRAGVAYLFPSTISSIDRRTFRYYRNILYDEISETEEKAFGDIILIQDQSTTDLIHMMIIIADSLVLSKNGKDNPQWAVQDKGSVIEIYKKRYKEKISFFFMRPKWRTLSVPTP